MTIGWARRVVTILNRWLTEAIGGGLWGLASNVHLRKVTVKLRLLHIWRTTENVRSMYQSSSKLFIFKRLTLAGAVRSSEEVLVVLDREEEAASLVSVVEAASCSL